LFAKGTIRWIGILILMVTVASFPAMLRAGDVEDFRFATKLMKDGLYSAAGEEFLRFAKKYPDSRYVADAYFNAGEAFMQAGKARRALDAFDLFVSSYPEDNRVCKALFYRGKIYSALKMFDDAAREFLAIPDKDISNPLVDRAFLEAGKSLISAGRFKEAEKTLRRLVFERKPSDVTPKAIYIYSTVLEGNRKGLRAKEILEELVVRYPEAPITAFALIKLGDMEQSSGRYDKAESYYRKVLDRFSEKTIREKALISLIELKELTRELDDSVELSLSFVREFPDSKLFTDTAMRGARVAFDLERYGDVVKFVEALRHGKEKFDDSSGLYTYLLASSYFRLGDYREALNEIERIQKNPLVSQEVLLNSTILKADLMMNMGKSTDALSLYTAALTYSPPSGDKIKILEKVAKLYRDEFRDTLMSIAYWDMCYRFATGDGDRERALWNGSVLREKSGMLKEAIRGFREIVTSFPSGEFFEKAKERLERLELRPASDVTVARRVASIVRRCASDIDCFSKIGILLLEDAHDFEGAIPYLEQAYRSQSNDTLKAKTGYYLALARYRLSKIAEDRGVARKSMEQALDLWRSIARDYVGTRWGEFAHRKYIEARFVDWDFSEKVSRINEYLKYYWRGTGRWWAFARKLSLFYDKAGQEERFVDSTIVMCKKIVGNKAAPLSLRKDAQLYMGYAYRISGKSKEAVSSFNKFVSEFNRDPRVKPLLYDLGEELLKLRKYTSALDAFQRGAEANKGTKLAEKCELRAGDCLYYLRRFSEAKKKYEGFLGMYPKSVLADEVRFRLVLVNDMMGLTREALALLKDLYESSSISRSLRIRVCKKYANALMEKGQYETAVQVCKELTSLKNDAESLTLMGEAELGARNYRDALKSFDSAIRTGKADTCRTFSGKVLSLAGLGRYSDVEKVLSQLLGTCKQEKALSRLLLKLGKFEIEHEKVESARARFSLISERFPSSEEASTSLYYSAICDLKQGGYREGIEKLEKFLKVAPDSPLVPNAYLKIASANYMIKNMNLSAKYYALAAESAVDPEIRYMALSNLGRVYQELEQWERAADVWKDVAEEFPGEGDVVETLFNLGFCYNRTQRYELAYEVYSRIPDLAITEEQEGRAHYWAGVSLKNMNRFKEAAAEFLRVPYLKTGGMWGVTAKLEAASCYEKLGEVDEARKLCKEIISSYGNGSDWGKLAQKILDRIEVKKEVDNKKGKTEKGGK